MSDLGLLGFFAVFYVVVAALQPLLFIMYAPAGKRRSLRCLFVLSICTAFWPFAVVLGASLSNEQLREFHLWMYGREEAS